MDNLKYSIENHIVCNKCVEELSNETNPEINLKIMLNLKLDLHLQDYRSGALDII